MSVSEPALNYRTRLQVVITDEVTGEITTVTPIQSIDLTIDSPHDIVHSTEKTNLGFVRRPIEVSFAITVLAIGDAVLNLTALQVSRKFFSIQVVPTEGTPEDWSFSDDGVILTNCVINNSTPTTATADGVARSIFRGNALLVTVGGSDYPIE